MAESREAKLIVSADDRASLTLNQIGRNLSGLGRRAGLGRLGQQLGNVGRSMAGLGRAAGGLMRSFGALAGIGGIAGLTLALRRSGQQLDEFSKLSRQVGLSVQDLRELGHVAEIQGVSQSALQGAVRRSARGFADMQAGVGRLTSQLSKSHPELFKQIKGAESSAEAFGMMLNALQQTTDEADRIRLSEMFFGTDEMGRIAELSNEEIAGLRANFRRLAGEITDEQARAVEGYNDSWTNFQTAIRGVSDAIAVDLLPAFTDTITAMGDWVAANREWLSQEVSEAIKDIGHAISSVDWAAFGQALREFGSTLDDLAHKVGGWRNVMIGAAVLGIASWLAPLARVGIELAKFGAVLLSTPIGWFVAAVGGAAALIWRDWDKFQPLFSGWWENIESAAGGLTEFLAGTFTGDFRRAFAGLGEIAKGLGNAWRNQQRIVFRLGASLVRWIDDTFGTDLRGVLNDLTSWMEDTFVQPVIDLIGQLPEAFDDLRQGWSDALDGVKAFLREWADWFHDTFVEPIMGGINRIKSAWESIRTLGGLRDSMPEGAAGSADMGRRAGQLVPPRPEARALGGPVFAGNPYKIGERGTELFVPGENGSILPNNLLRRMIGDASSGGGGSRLEGAAELMVRFANAPAGTRATAKSDGGLFRRIVLDTGAAMKPAGS